MSSVFHRDLQKDPCYVTHNDKTTSSCLIGWVKGEPNSQLLDLSSGAGSVTLGYRNSEVRQAIGEQAIKLPYIHSANFTCPPVEDLAERLIAEVAYPGSKFAGGKVIFLNTGAEAVEAACKLAIQYYAELELPGLVQLIGLRHSYHGNSFGMLGLSDHPRKQPYRGFPFFVWRAELDSASVGDVLDNIGVGTTPVMVAETIGGTTLGIEPRPAQFLSNAARQLAEHNGLLILDEVLSGNYRSGRLFSYQYLKETGWESDFEPDIICLGKGLTAGYFPLSAVIVSKNIVKAIEQNSGRLWHSTTNQNHPIGCAAGLAAMDVYKQLDFAAFHRMVADAIWDLTECKNIHGITGLGSLRGIHLDPQVPNLHKLVRQYALDLGLALYTEGQTIDGQGNFIMFAPPYCMTENEMRVGIEKLIRAIDLAVANVAGVNMVGVS